MKKLLLSAFALVCISANMMAAPYYVCVNGTDYYYAAPTGDLDFQDRDQFKVSCLSLSTGDLIKCYDAGNGNSWHINAIDSFGAYNNFHNNGEAFMCKVADTYDLYIKLKYQDDLLYVQTSSGNCTPAEAVDPSQTVYASSVPEQCPDVMLQCFYWDSYTNKGYGNTQWATLQPQAAEMGQWFDLIWLPPSAMSSGGTGYLPKIYSTQRSSWGTRAQLLDLINAFHYNGARVVADVVVNHVDGTCNLPAQKFGSYGTFEPTSAWICNTDEMNWPKSKDKDWPAAFGDCWGTASGAADDGYGLEANYDSGRDWDHTNADVRAMIKAYAQWLINVLGYDGFRYDYCKGFHNSHINEYNSAAKAYFSVMEYWDGDVNVLQSHIADAGMNTLTFDFATKYTAFNNGIAAGNYAGCKGAGLPGVGKSRYAVTFLDSHDSFQRDNNEFLGKDNSMANAANKQKVMQCNAYLLSMPGIPCIFYPHWVTFKEDLKKLINARYKTGVHSESAVNDETGDGFYKATITGTNGSIRLLLGPNSGYNTTPSGYTLAAKGTNWGVYYQMTTPRGDKCDNRTPLRGATAIETVPAATKPLGKKVIENGHIYLIKDGQWFNTLGQRVK